MEDSNQTPFKELIIPDLFPGVNALRNAGITKFGEIPTTQNELVALDGIGVVISEKILEELNTQKAIFEESLKTNGGEIPSTDESVEDQQGASQDNKSPDAPPAVPNEELPADASDFNTHTPESGNAGGAAGDNPTTNNENEDSPEGSVEDTASPNPPNPNQPTEATVGGKDLYKKAAMRRARNRR